MKEGREPQSMDFSSGNILPPDFDAEKLLVEDGEIMEKDVPSDKSKDSENEKNNEILGEEIKEEIKVFSTDLFKIFLAGGFGSISFSLRDEIEDSIRGIIYGKDEKWDMFVYDDKYRGAIKLFLDEYLNFCRANKEDKNFEKFLSSTSDCLFHQSPDITESLKVSENFDFIVKVNRLRDTQNYFGYDAFEGMEEKINFSFDENIANEILEKYNRSKISEKFDILHVIEKLYSNCIQHGSTYQKTLDIYEGLLDEIANDNKSSFIGGYLELIKMNINQDYENEFGDGNNYDYDLNSDDNFSREWRESENLKEIINSNIEINQLEKIIPVGEGVLAIYNGNNIPMKFAKIDKYFLENNRPAVSNYDIRRIKEAIDFDSGQPNIDFDYFFDYFNDKILKPHYNLGDSDDEIIAEKWESISGGRITKETYLEFIKFKRAKNEIKEDVSKYQDDKKHEIILTFNT